MFINVSNLFSLFYLPDVCVEKSIMCGGSWHEVCES